MNRQITPAVRTGRKARVALSGPAGSGKTWTALVIARELAPQGKVLVIDTEKGSASLYADEFTFETIDWAPPFDPRELAGAIGETSRSYDVVIADSLSHFWQGEGGTLTIVDGAAARARGNSFAGWKEGTPAQDQMVAAMLAADCHIIATMRSKTEYVLELQNGRQVPRKVGMAPVQRDGIEYEFTVTADLDYEHSVLIAKTRCAPLADKMFKAGRASDMGRILREWLDGAQPAAAARAALSSGGDRPESLPATGRPSAPPNVDPETGEVGAGRPFTDDEILSRTGTNQYARAIHIRATEMKVDAELLAQIIEGITGDPSANSVNRDNKDAVLAGINAAAPF